VGRRSALESDGDARKGRQKKQSGVRTQLTRSRCAEPAFSALPLPSPTRKKVVTSPSPLSLFLPLPPTHRRRTRPLTSPARKRVTSPSRRPPLHLLPYRLPLLPPPPPPSTLRPPPLSRQRRSPSSLPPSTPPFLPPFPLRMSNERSPRPSSSVA
jgi:hypothetical protein